MHPFFSFISKIKTDIKNKTSHSIRHLLSYSVRDCISVPGIYIRKTISPILRKAYRYHVDYKIVIDNSVPLTRSRTGRIFAVNHRQKEDIIISMLVSDSSAYTVFGGTDIALDTMNGLGLWAYGIILIDRFDKASRKSAYDKMKYIIEHGGNIIIYPEGYWNIADDGESDEYHGADSHNSDSWLVQDLNMGMFRLSQETGCEIVPIILHYDEINGKICYGNRGEPFSVSAEDNILERKDDFLSIMQTTYYNMIEKYSTYNRCQLESDGISLKKKNRRQIQQLLKAVEIEQTGYKMDMQTEKLIGKARNKKHLITEKEAFAHLSHIVPTDKNAFLFRK